MSGVENCIKSAKLDGSKQNVENVSGCAADAYCATYGVPPGICSAVSGPVVGAIYDFFSGMFGGPKWDCSKYSPIMINGQPDPPVGSCALSWFISKYGAAGAAQYAKASAAYAAGAKGRERDALAQVVATSIWADFEKRFDVAVGKILDGVPGAYTGWKCNSGVKPPNGSPRWAGSAGCAAITSALANDIYRKFRVAVVSSGGPAVVVGGVPIYTTAADYTGYNPNPYAATASNGVADQILRMGSNIARLQAQFASIYVPPPKRVPSSAAKQNVPAWAWLALAGGAGALGFAAWKRRHRRA